MVFLLVLALLSGAVSGAPGGICPAGDAISTELERLGALSALRDLGTAEVTIQGASLNIVVRNHQGVVLGERAVEAPAECDARAAVAAVLIAAWAGDWPELAHHLPQRRREALLRHLLARLRNPQAWAWPALT